MLATKVRLPMEAKNFNHSGATRVNIMREIEASLRRLQTDYVDLYQVHGWDSNTPLEETLRTLDDLVRQGKVRYIGLSNLMSWQAATAVMLQERMATGKVRDRTNVLQPGGALTRIRFNLSRNITTSASWSGARSPTVFCPASTAVIIRRPPVAGSRRQDSSCHSRRNSGTGW